MAQLILFPSQTTSNDIVPDELDFININKIEQDNIILNTTLGFSSTNLVVDLDSVDVSNLGITYSIDSINYQESNTFEINSEGDYTVYVKDVFGCVKNSSFEITEIKKRNNYINIPEANSINFVQVKSIDNINNFKNNYNSIQCENLNHFKYKGDILFNKKDKPGLQIKSNYNNLKVYLRNEFDESVELLMSKKSNNLDKYKKIDCLVYSIRSSKLAVYFESGNEYDNTNNISNTFELNGNLPDFAKIGNSVDVEGFGVLEISSIEIDYDINKKVIIFEYDYEGEEIESKATCIYDLIEYDIYEHYFNFEFLNSGLYDVYIKAEDSDGNNVEFVSENIDLQDNHENTLAIHYYNEDNKDIFYKYGFINQARFEYSDIARFNVEENEININDNISSSIKSDLNFGDKFLFEDLANKRLDCLSIALSSESVFINGIGYIKNNNINIEKQDRTNIYSLDVDMLKTNVNLVISTSRLSLLDYLIPNILPVN